MHMLLFLLYSYLLFCIFYLAIGSMENEGETLNYVGTCSCSFFDTKIYSNIFCEARAMFLISKPVSVYPWPFLSESTCTDRNT